ncbi:FAR11/STRIP family protein [Aspergillus clavatus NRRL 1]|uniref:Pheromone-dependent cell cycle arrest protein Far11, putative n=1 Tax=Aspergillus clavatus (strain ATCC 1007 / CBS 513.65 / DSM 816 / NCTC 3887 / NRRL 1 / QM 1276 / 107) TaxID=344612 RepID=A1CMD7_ASPCL|nr:pheromone-dependent cell cycle arrest protein Far11, putative [Aspergillus clavatus NRRL 1]EAW08724.1 pheromone-dependent cell cycle arrest protein Far11, putative [Aspergillus clavatus NRRL 1]
MDEAGTPERSAMEEHHIVKADEVDQTGTDITTLSDEQLMEEVAEGLRQDQASNAAAPLQNGLQEHKPKSSRRPELRRDGSAPPPPLQPPPPAPGQQSSERPPDSLSLAQLRQLVQEMPKVDQPAYAFEYADSQPLVEEIEEWFQYSEFDRVMLSGMKSAFEQKWAAFCEDQPAVSVRLSWIDASYDLRKSFMAQMIDALQETELPVRNEALEIICYTVTGEWGSTAGRAVPEYPETLSPQAVTDTPKSRSLQITWMERNVNLVNECSGLEPLLQCLCNALGKPRAAPGSDSDGPVSNLDIAASEHEANLVLTTLYVVVEIGRRQEKHDSRNTSVRDTLMGLKPSLPVFLVEVIARLRWDDSANIPLTRIILLLWKSLLLFFGGTESLKKAKEELEPRMEARENSSNRRTPFLTASPLDYHLFRQEITSKYPAYNPPPLAVPLELESNSILPPLPQHSNRVNSSNGLFSGVGPSMASGNGSILHQSVHIATPAPSPPPSPIGPGGKAGKKQNYQTNQNFPFMYPPLDDSSNDIGGKGTTERQDTLVGKKWEGSDVPASVIEAGKLFSTHVKMTRAMRQLWEERERFMKYDRGWYLDDGAPDEEEDLSYEIAQDLEDLKLSGARKRSQDCAPHKETDNEDIQRRLDAVESFYSQVLVHLQSVTIVFLKIVLTNVSAMVNQANGQNGHAMGRSNKNINIVSSDGYGAPNGFAAGHNGFPESFNVDAAIDELDNLRLREITGKAISGSLLLMLKWFKRSHILKFEYMTQLLLDSNYLPLILKMFAHQDIDQAIAQKNDREELGFFHFCHLNSDHPPDSAENSEEESSASEDEAVPPPILRQRPDANVGTSSVRGPSPQEALPEFVEGQARPEVDELGYPIASQPKEPITEFSFRNFFSAINYLHIMQKITRDKAHRCLLLVQYKSSTILRKGLKIPDPHLRFYTLKLFKSQVPYCGRKWRQSNMRVITAIYLYCRPELRDDWLAGSDIDAEVEEALPLEQALRGLTHWWHLRRYKDVMGGEERASLMEEERDFFVRELEAMGWGFVGEELLNEEAEMAAANGAMMNGTEWDGAPLQMEGW